MLSIRSLADMEHLGVAVADGRDLRMKIPPDWPVNGEQRIGYVTVMRLCEWVRELHWRLDIETNVDTAVDTVTRSLRADFTAPITGGLEVIGSYAVSSFRERSYGLEMSLASPDGERLACVKVINVFVDPLTLKAASPPRVLAVALRKLADLHIRVT